MCECAINAFAFTTVVAIINADANRCIKFCSKTQKRKNAKNAKTGLKSTKIAAFLKIFLKDVEAKTCFIASYTKLIIKKCL